MTHEIEKAIAWHRYGYQPDCFVAHVDREMPTEMFQYDECRLVGHEIIEGKQFVWVEKRYLQTYQRKLYKLFRDPRSAFYTVDRWASFGWKPEHEQQWHYPERKWCDADD